MHATISNSQYINIIVLTAGLEDKRLQIHRNVSIPVWFLVGSLLILLSISGTLAISAAAAAAGTDTATDGGQAVSHGGAARAALVMQDFPEDASFVPTTLVEVVTPVDETVGS